MEKRGASLFGALRTRVFLRKSVFDGMKEKLRSRPHTPVRASRIGMDKLEGFVKENHIRIAALTIPKEQASETAEMLISCGVKGIWNFAHTDLKLPGNIVVENVHLSESLMHLSYNLLKMEQEV